MGELHTMEPGLSFERNSMANQLFWTHSLTLNNSPRIMAVPCTLRLGPPLREAYHKP